MIKAVCVLAVDINGDLLMPADAKSSGISSPRLADSFGGEALLGETPRLAALRLVQEQASLNVEPYRLQFVGTRYRRTEDTELHVFVIDRIDPDQLKLPDGLRVVVAKPMDMIEEIKYSRSLREVVKDYVGKFAKS